MKSLNLKIGQIFNHWTIIDTIPQSRGAARKYLCKCVCGKEKEVYQSHLVRNNSRSCGCKQPKKNKHYKWTGIEEMPGEVFANIKNSANGKGRQAIQIDISAQDIYDLYIKQDKKCALSGIEIGFEPKTASLDRIDPNKGYIKNNIQWVHKDVNRMKNIFSQERFIEVCSLVAKFQK